MNLPPVYVGRRRHWLVTVVGCGMVQAACVIGIAALMQRALDQELASGNAPGVWTFLAGIVALGLLGGAARWVERLTAEYLGQDYVHELRLKMFSALARKSPDARSAEGRGAVPLRFMTDLNALRQWISLGQSRLIVALLLLAATLGYLLVLSPVAAGAVLAVLAAATGTSLFLGRLLEQAVVRSRQRRARLANLVAERVANLSAIIGFGRLPSEKAQLERHSRELGGAMADRALWTGGLRGTTEFAIRLAMAAVLGVLLIQLGQGQVSPGTILAAVSVVALLVTPLRDLSRVQEYWTAARVSRAKLSGFLTSEQSPARRNRAIAETHGILQLQDLHLAAGQRPFSTVVPAGSRVLVSGLNGAGKTTLLWTIAGIRRPLAGRVTIDGEAAHRLDRHSLQSSVGIASPALPLLRGTVQLNLRYRAPKADEAALQAVCVQTGLADLLGSWPALLDYRVADEGSNLSRGEQARLQLARAIVCAPGILLLDELDAHLDEPGRTLLRQLIVDYPGTVIFTSHDPVTVALADTEWQVGADGIRLLSRTSPVQPVALPVEMPS